MYTPFHRLVSIYEKNSDMPVKEMKDILAIIFSIPAWSATAAGILNTLNKYSKGQLGNPEQTEQEPLFILKLRPLANVTEASKRFTNQQYHDNSQLFSVLLNWRQLFFFISLVRFCMTCLHLPFLLQIVCFLANPIAWICKKIYISKYLHFPLKISLF